MIAFHNVTKRFGAHTVLDNVNFHIKPKDFVVLTGPSGSGKSTVVALIIGAEKPDSGTVEVDDLVINDMDEATLQLYRRSVGVVFQDYKLLPSKTVFENTAFALEVCDASDDEIAKRVPEALAKVGLLNHQDQFPDQLSGGERQRLAIARALVHQPAFIIADEPTGNLDAENARSIMKLLQKLHREEGVTVLVTTHDPLVLELAKGSVLRLEHKKII